MLRKIAICMGLLGGLWLLAAGAAAEPEQTSHPALTLRFEQPERFTDLRAASESQLQFQARTLAGFERIFAELADELPDGWTWQVTITDIDLAGDVRHDVGAERFRTVTASYPPRVNLNHRLLDDQGEVVMDAEERLLDLSFMHRLPGSTLRHQTLHYEHQMLKRWFEQSIRPKFELRDNQ